ncbi:hypothetical protein ACN23B_27620 (plasmid) [Anabaena sp. FACHB-709]|uniref:Replication protein O n=1 Tax=Anabaena cylindrica FACHB-318 TaxID=2692880 RepID=A0ABR7ZQ98_ANACY|nr:MULTISPECIES: hypothetical protein [Nostocaceae]MBD2174381.1 hypothetical protein [Anabaena cylindrica FACHB-318]MBD2266136.1 hypothetical protein [Anabaena sp. FACHB-709]MBD2275562.1 hypothetical protein [Nostoc sp. PCC 7120 = FACHB-418]MBD2286466.1 hypothetical protein [Anabaena cylindrica FACHB-170]RUR73531.1 hypothetical protein DSM107007_53750 [Nostoc sp. PCC 7120 = FACHB-418]
MTSKLITPESPLLVPPLLAVEIGLTEAMILQQIHYFCQISKHIKRDGRRWFWKTLKDWGETLPFLKPSAIRRAIANLRDNFKLIDVCRHSEKTWYQANWFTVNVENVQALWNRICQNQQIDVSNLDISICSHTADHNKDFPLKDFTSQQHSAVEFEKSEEVKPEILECKQEVICQTPELELSQVTHFVDEPEQDDSTSKTDHHDGHSSAAVSSFHNEDSGDDYTDLQEKSVQPSQQEVQEILQQLREIPCTPKFRLNGEIQRTVKRYWANVPGAIAYLKEAVRTWKGIKSPEAVFVAACRERRKPEAQQAKSDAIAWFDWARQQRIVIAMSGEVVYTADGEAVALAEMMRRYPVIEDGRTVARKSWG